MTDYVKSQPGKQPLEQDEKGSFARGSDKKDDGIAVKEKESEISKHRGNKRRPHSLREKKDSRDKTEGLKEVQGSSKSPDNTKTEGNKDVISWLNKKISKQEESSLKEKRYEKEKPRDGKKNKEQRDTSRKVLDKGDNKVNIKEYEKNHQGPRSKTPNFRSDVKHFDSKRGRERKAKVSSREGRDFDPNHVQTTFLDYQINNDESNEKLVGLNVNVVDGKYVGKREKLRESLMYFNSHLSRDQEHSQEYFQSVFQGGVFNSPYQYFQPYGVEFNYLQYQDCGNMNYNYFQGYQPLNQENFVYQANTIGPPEVGKRNRQKYHFKASRSKLQMHGSSINVDTNHSEQASMLTEQLLNETYECMVCCEKIGCKAAVWSCVNCYHVFHLRCARKWARSSVAVVEGDDGGWRCPACQNISQSVPNVYTCFCGKLMDPKWNPRDGITPHSCGELCKKKRQTLDCSHLCNQLCHPGPCPSCPVMVKKFCECLKESQQMRCGQKTVIKCKAVCKKMLNCSVHTCEKICHSGPCDLCDVSEEQGCYCGITSRQALCGSGEIDIIDDKKGYFSCSNICQRPLDCGNHTCGDICHKGKCTPCKMKPELITTCPCGKKTLLQLLGPDKQRQSCLDPVKSCGWICGKVLSCSPKGGTSDSNAEHCCKQPCHPGNCGPCDGISVIFCRCGGMKKEIKCCDRTSEAFLCDRRCNKKRKCGRHKCNKKCCVDKEHKCELTCGKKLSCGSHSCDEPCHMGYCPPCIMTSFEELSCHCGATVLFPPLPCGTSPPACTKPCSRQHSCSHPVYHSCHNDELCPPCTVLTKKMCNGNHELRYNIPCHLTYASCGKKCGSLLPCGHNCIRVCHKPPCINNQEPCTQPCKEVRKECGHICGSPCHNGTACPGKPCRVKMKIFCKCGRRSDMVYCLQGADKSTLVQYYQRLTTEMLASKMKDIQQGQTVDISTVMLDDKATRQRLAEALEIDESTEAALNIPRMVYSPFLVNEARTNMSFIQSLEKTFENLIAIAKKLQSGQKSHAFPPMNANKRRIIHELCVHYNCSSLSYDSEPNRNCVITATKDSKLPPSTLSVQVSRFINPPAPTPVPYLPSDDVSNTSVKKKSMDEKKPKTWSQVPDYFADNFND